MHNEYFTVNEVGPIEKDDWELKKELGFNKEKRKYNFLTDKKIWFIFNHISYRPENLDLDADSPLKIQEQDQEKLIKIRYETVAKNLSKNQDIDLTTLNNVKYTSLLTKFYHNGITAKFNLLLRANSTIEANVTHNTSASNRLGISYKFDSLNKNLMSIGFRKKFDDGKFNAKARFESPSNDKLFSLSGKKNFGFVERNILDSCMVAVGGAGLFDRENQLRHSWLNLLVKMNLVNKSRSPFDRCLFDM
jgi:hypothetical protein